MNAAENGWPVLRGERTWKPLSIFSASVSAAIATWCFVIGGFVSFYLGAVHGTLAIIAGSLIGILLIVLACVPISSKYGLDAVTSTRPQFGTRGSLLSVVLVYGSILGWNTILFVLLGRAVRELLIAFGVVGHEGTGWIVGLAGTLGALLIVAMLLRGQNSVRDYGPIIAVSVLVLSFIVLVLLLVQFGVSTLLAAPATWPAESNSVNWASGLEVLIASNLSWWAYTGAIVRNGPSARRALWPVVIGLGLGVGIGSLTGLYAGLLLPESGGDPTQFLVQVGGPVVGVISLLFILVANIGTGLVGTFASTIALRQLPGLRSLGWGATVVVGALPVIVLVAFFGDGLFDYFNVFVAFLGLCFAPMCGIQIADFYVLRRHRLDVTSLYLNDKRSKYFYWGGFNPIALVAFAVGVAVYIYLLDPVTYSSRTPFEFMTATLPSALIAGVVYWAGTSLIAKPAAKGGYAEAGTQRAEAELIEQ
ncbi:purine-cytosine permease family protein [Ruicaihuangia caeni]|uniref:Cytosine permease n=1 Tax=Ruicaihuangia caeni TaxID=3042517 RepID=A0AAW6TCX1_9MICO|nr:cytosine permease [Klugiella sp. YN-L-19]MDI2098912.1 cytosine permease [Klugiella sp. YN-L-19]